MDDNVIRVYNVTKNFGKLCAVCGLGFEVERATCFGLLGPNGAGKTTMMKMIYGRAMRNQGPDSVINVFGYDPAVQELQIKYLSGVVPQENNLDEELNVRQNLMVYARFYDIPGSEAKGRITELLDFLELQEKIDSPIRALSGGMKRRLVIARALLNNPKLLILDEPTTGLDPQVRHLIWDKIRQLKKSGLTILLTTHYMEEAFEICDSILIMHNGQKIIEGNPRRLLESNIERYVLELYTVETGKRIAEPANVRADHSREVSLFYSNDLGALKHISDPLESWQYRLRPSNLEDLFLKITGRGLNEAQ